ncbi:MAG TPA: preprotein translocase subunit SecG [Blastocatellia bacterium]|nr:preprotein translocase subunit SecG [Blastocatellia bacterium]
MYYILMALYIVACFVLILFVLLQPGKSDAAAVFGGGANTAAFGPRGTATVLAKITITAAIVFFLIAFLFSIPGIFEKRSIGEGVNQSEQAPAPAPLPAPEQQPATVPLTPAPAPTAAPNANSAAAKPETITRPTDAAKNGNAAKANANKK